MTTAPTDPVQPPSEGGFLAPRPGAAPGDHCYRCGKPTPLGVSLCNACNPGRIKGPSATQLHATILGGVILGAIVLLIGWHFAVGQGGPYTGTIVARAMNPDGGPTVTITVSNGGTRSGVANCRVTRDGAPRPDDPTYRPDRLDPGAFTSFTRTLPAPAETVAAYDLPRMTVICT